jgi:glycosyltransferase involved in cell wall biosynthesis
VRAKRLLVLTYYYPPTPSIGGARWAAMSRHLRAMGHEVTVVTSVAHGKLPDDRSSDVVRTPDLVSSDALRRALRRPPLPQAGVEVAVDTPAPRVLTRVLVPDGYVLSWMPAAVLAVGRILKSRPIDCLITSGPPNSTHVAALLLGRSRPPWIADFRDGWHFEPLAEPWPTKGQRALDCFLERSVGRHAQAAIGATGPIADDLTNRLGLRAHWIPNAWDPQAEVSAAPDVCEPGVTTVVHTGTLSGPRGRDPRPFFEALRAVTTEGKRIRLVLAGRLSSEDQRLLAEAGVGDAVRHVGLLDKASALGLQRAADALLLMTGTDKSEATGKLYEYLAAGRPIIALAQDNEAARIVQMTGTGRTVPSKDPVAIAAALREAAEGTLPYAPRDLERFTYPGPAEAVAELVDEVATSKS